GPTRSTRCARRQAQWRWPERGRGEACLAWAASAGSLGDEPQKPAGRERLLTENVRHAFAGARSRPSRLRPRVRGRAGLLWGGAGGGVDSSGGRVSGFGAAIAGNVPLGAGLSSSASLQAAVAMFLVAAGQVDRFEPVDFADDEPGRNNRMMLAAKLQRMENEF